MRLKLAASLHQAFPSAHPDPLARPPEPGDAAQLAVLMYEAYRGTIDDGGESLEDAASEVAKLFAGDYGVFNMQVSEVILREGRIVAASLVTTYEGLPMLAFSMTVPDWKRQGLARAGLVRTLWRLKRAGLHTIQLAVTQGNTPAENLYASLGFVKV